MPEVPKFLHSPKQRDGGFYETQAKQYLEAQGLVVVAQNWLQPKIGELDLIMVQPKIHDRGWDILVFVEVRKRKSSGFGDALMSVTLAKQRKLIKTARYFLQQYPKYADLECRFDVIAYDENKCKGTIKDEDDVTQEQFQPTWVQGAFISAAW